MAWQVMHGRKLARTYANTHVKPPAVREPEGGLTAVTDLLRILNNWTDRVGYCKFFTAGSLRKTFFQGNEDVMFGFGLRLLTSSVLL